MAGMKRAGVSFYEPDANQKADWIAVGRSSTRLGQHEKELTGSLSLFEELQEVADAPLATMCTMSSLLNASAVSHRSTLL